MSESQFLDDCQPPWIVFPRLDPDELSRHLKQGVAEPWFDQNWRPFWSSLSQEQRAEYLDHWHAPQDWRDAVRFFFEEQSKVDPAIDAAESDHYLEEFRRSRTSKRSLLDRLFRRS
jgi:hypothetical protein